VLLRLLFLGIDSFWLDEAYSVTSVTGLGAREVWHSSPDPNHPPLYFVVLWTALHLGGVSEFVARLPSALASIVNLALVYVLSRRLGLTTSAARWALLLMAFAPVDIWYAQEARMYALVATAALGFAIALTIESWVGTVFAAMAIAVGLYVDFTMVALSAVIAGLWCVRWWTVDRRLSRLGAVALALMMGWTAFFAEWRHLGEVLRRIDTVPLLVNLRRTFGLRVTPGMPAVVTVLMISGALAATGAGWWRALRSPAFTRAWGWLAWIAFVGATIAFAVPRGYSAKQFLATGWPFVVMALAWSLTDGLTILKSRAFTSTRDFRLPVALAVSVSAAIVTVATPRADWRAAVSHLNQRAPRIDAVWLDPSWNATPYAFYKPAVAAAATPLQSVEANGWRAGSTREVCLVAERFGATPPTSPTEAWLDANGRLVEAAPFARLEVRCYAH
jgi:uncharacterized membrane protein